MLKVTCPKFFFSGDKFCICLSISWRLEFLICFITNIHSNAESQHSSNSGTSAAKNSIFDGINSGNKIQCGLDQGKVLKLTHANM